MSIDFDAFHNWAVGKFGDPNINISGHEVQINSPFVPEYSIDTGYHCWCRPDYNAYHCFKTDEHGSLYSFVSQFEPCEMVDVDEVLGNLAQLSALEDKIRSLFNNKKEERPDINRGLLNLPPEAIAVNHLPIAQKDRVTSYMAKRKLPTTGLYYCHTGRYRDRIIIPYWGPNNDLIYFNGRDLSGKDGPRYLGPPKEVGVGKGDVLWMKSWPGRGKLYLCEGEFNAMSLCQADLQAGACGGKNLSDRQLIMLMSYDVTFCFDNDKSGQEALHKFSAYKKSFHGGRATSVGYVLPPKGFKDWNEFLIQTSPGALNYYVTRQEKELTWDNFLVNAAKTIGLQ